MQIGVPYRLRIVAHDDLAALEPRIRQAINEKISRGRMNVMIGLQEGANGASALALDTALARSYHQAMLTLQKELDAPGEITIGAILQAPGVMRYPEHSVQPDAAWPAVQRALATALGHDWGEPTAEEVWDELRSVSLNWHHGMSYARLDAHGGLGLTRRGAPLRRRPPRRAFADLGARRGERRRLVPRRARLGVRLHGDRA